MTEIMGAKSLPKDSKKEILVLFFLLGLVHILPWNFFQTANEYWMYKFRNVDLDVVSSKDRTTLQTMFAPSLAITLGVPNVCFLLLSIIYGYRFSLKFRLIGSVLGILVALIICTIFININTDSWQEEFFGITIVILAVVSGSNSVFGFTVYSMLNNFPTDYFTSYIYGQGLATTVISILQVFSLGVGLSEQLSALVYFICGILVVGVTLIALLRAQNNEFYTYHTNQSQYIKKNDEMITLAEVKTAARKIWLIIFTITCYTFTLTFNYPSITSLVVSEYEGASEWNDTYFVPVINFLMFSVVDYCGRILGKVLRNKVNAAQLATFSFIRVLIICPLVMLSNAQPRNHLPVVFGSDYQYILIVLLFAITNGLVISLFSLLIPKLVPAHELKRTLEVFAVVLGLTVALLSFLGFVSVKLL